MQVGRVFDTVTKYDTPDVIVAQRALRTPVQMLIAWLDPIVTRKPSPSFWDIFPSVDLTTSPSHPHTRRFVTKDYFFADEGVVAQLNLEQLDGTWDRAYLWTSFPKDEVIKVDKNVRQICGCETPYLFHLMPLVYNFNHSIETSGFSCPLYLGTTFTNKDWDHYIDEFTGCTHTISLDASSFDTSISSQLYDCVVQIRAHFLTTAAEKHKLTRLYQSIVHKNIVEPDGRIFRVDHGTPSGQPSTAHDNSLIMWLVMTSFLVSQKWSFEDIEEAVALAIYGDDCVAGFPEHPGFSPQDIQEYFNSFGIVLKLSHPSWVDWTQVDFLSRQPIPHKGGFVPVMVRHRKMLESMRWPDAKLTIQQQMERLLALRDLTLGTPSWDEANVILQSQLTAWAPVYSNDVWYLKLKARIHSAEYMLDVLCSHMIVQQSGFVSSGGLTLNDPPSKNFLVMSEQKHNHNKKKQSAKVKQVVKKTVTVVKQSKKAAPAARAAPKRAQKQKSAKGGASSGAAHILRARYAPSKVPPIHFPNVGFSAPGSVATKDRMNIVLPACSNATYDPNHQYVIFALQNSYTQPGVLVSAISNSGGLSWSAIGQTGSYPTMMANAELLRVNAVSVTFMDSANALVTDGTCWYLNWNSLAGSSVNRPGSVATIVGNDLATECRLQEMRKKEFPLPPTRLSQQDYQLVDYVSGAEQMANMSVFCFRASTGISITATVTFQIEWIPNAVGQTIVETKTSVVTEAAVEQVSASAMAVGALNNTGPASIGNRVDQFVNSGKEVVKAGRGFMSVAKEVWDFASPLVTGFATLLGFLSPEQRPQYLWTVVRYQMKLQDFHMQYPTILPYDDFIHLWRFIHGSTVDWQTRERKKLYLPNNLWPFFAAILSEVLAESTPAIRRHFLSVHPGLTLMAYAVDPALVNSPWSINGNQLLCGGALASNIEASPGVGLPRRLITTASNAFITAGSPPLMIMLIGTEQHTLELDALSSRLLMAKYHPSPRAVAPFQRLRPLAFDPADWVKTMDITIDDCESQDNYEDCKQ